MDWWIDDSLPVGPLGPEPAMFDGKNIQIISTTGIANPDIESKLKKYFLFSQNGSQIIPSGSTVSWTWSGEL